MNHPVKLLRHCLIALAVLSGLLAACGTDADAAGAAQTVEAYLQARVEEDVDQMILLSCPEWEAQARLEAVSFQAMDASLEGVTCQPGESQGDGTLVDCEGKIVTTYQGEQREWSVSEHPYRVVQQDGEWRMCGYGQ